MALAHAVENKVERPTGVATRSRSGAGWRDGDAYTQRLGEMNGASGPAGPPPAPPLRLRWVPTPPPEGSADEIRQTGVFGSRRCVANCITERAEKGSRRCCCAKVDQGGLCSAGRVRRIDRVGLLAEGHHGSGGDQIG